MKTLFHSILVSFFIVVISFISCKKEYSCEGCRDKNQPPVANAGRDTIIVLPVDSIRLNGSASADPDGKIIEWRWTKISGPASFIITNNSSAITTVKKLSAGGYQFELKVTDNGGLSATDTAIVIVKTEDVTSIGCNITIETLAHLPTPGRVGYAVSARNKILFTRPGISNGVVDIYDTLTHSWETVNGMYATTSYLPEQSAYKIAKVGSKLIFSVMANPMDTAQGQLVNIYDAVSNSWSITHLAQGREFYAMAVAGNKKSFMRREIIIQKRWMYIMQLLIPGQLLILTKQETIWLL